MDDQVLPQDDQQEARGMEVAYQEQEVQMAQECIPPTEKQGYIHD